MKAIVEEKDKGIEYPCLMKSTVSDLIVLFYGDQTGVVVYRDGEEYPIGHHSDSWTTSLFKSFKDRLILEN